MFPYTAAPSARFVRRVYDFSVDNRFESNYRSSSITHAVESQHCPVALTIAGSDSGGGAGIQADLKTFAAFGVHGASAIACLTAQNPRRVLAVESTTAKMLRQQIEAVFQELRPAAVKTGMLLSAENVRAVANFFEARRPRV